MGFSPLIMMAASTAVSVASTIQQGRHQKAWLDYQNEQIAADARAEKGAAAIHAEKIRKMAKRTAGEARAALSASGVSVDEGTALNINSEIYSNAEEDAAMAVFGGGNRAARLSAEIEGNEIRKDASAKATRINTASSVLSGASQMYSGWRTQQPAAGGTQ